MVKFSNACLIALTFFLLVGCGGFSQEDIELKARDGEITKKDFGDIQNKIKLSGPTLLKDSTRLYNYIKKLLKSENISANVWDPNENIEDKPFNVNIYLENSGSMLGYVRMKGQSEFQNTIQNVLSSISNNVSCDTLTLNYINSSIQSIDNNATLMEVENFAKYPFGKNQKMASSSILEDIIHQVLEKSNPNNVSILISDFILSPGRESAMPYLESARISIKNNLIKKINLDNNLAVAIFQMQSTFRGIYYDYQDHQIKLNAIRPFYFWVIGESKNIKTLMSSHSFPGSTNQVIFQRALNKQNIKYKFLVGLSHRIGSYNHDNRNISEATAKNNKFGFTIAAHLNEIMKSDKYLSDLSNYYLSDTTYKLSITKDAASPSLSKLYNFMLTTHRLTDEYLTIGLLGKNPNWVKESSSVDDSNINNNNEEQRKTFGLNYLIGGASDAFYPNTERNIISSISIQIKK